MTKRFHFDSPAEVYRAGAAVVWCFDDRFTLAVQKFLKRSAIGRVDSIRVAGGVKPLASPGDESERNFVIEQLRLSRKLHSTERVILVSHADCGAYGGRARFAGDAIAEREYHCAELARARNLIQSALPEVTVECLFVDFDGVWEAETAGATAAD
jgi:carbonic anhydrase